MEKALEALVKPKSGTSRTASKHATDASLVDRLMDFDSSRIQLILKEAGLPASGSKPALRIYVEQSLKSGSLSQNLITDYIFSWEPWTHRHCYFIKLNPKDLGHLRAPEGLETTLEETDFADRIDAAKKFFIPGSLTIDTVKIAKDVLTVTLVAPLYTYQHVETRYDDRTQTRTKIEHLNVTRKVYMLELNLKSGRGFLSIPAVQRGRSYSKEFVTVEKMIKKIFGIGAFEIVQIEAAIQKLMASETSISNSIHVRLASGRKVQVKSPSKKTPVFDATTKKLEQAVSGHYMEGSFYYAEDPAKPEFRYKIHNDHRLGIFSDLDEEDFREVMELVLENV